jgi:hypothetical protein
MGKYFTNQEQYDREERRRHYRVKCPLCDGTGTALARVIDIIANCSACGGTGSVETTIKLEIGARREKRQCSACGGSGKRTEQRINIRTFQSAFQTCYFYFDDGKQHSISDRSHFTTIDLEGAAQAFFAKWQPAAQSTYLRERRERERKQAEERARQEEINKQELKQRRIREGVCANCGETLGVLDKISGRQAHKRCP